MTSNTELYQAVTDRMISALEAGTVPWRKPWTAAGAGLPMRMSNNRPYRGINIFILYWAAEQANYRSTWWGTYKRIRELGGQVRRDEKSTVVTFWKRLRVKDATAEDGYKIIPMLRTYRVFNAEQADGLPERYYPRADGTPAAPEEIESAELLIKTYLAQPGTPSLSYDGGDRAYYVPATDSIHLPPIAAFDSAAERYSTEFHELVHSTGHPTRLNRPGITGLDHFGSDRYSREELVAEMGAAMLCAITGTETQSSFDNSAAYLASWLRALRADPKLVISAAGAAQKASDLIRGIQWESDSEE